MFLNSKKETIIFNKNTVNWVVRNVPDFEFLLFENGINSIGIKEKNIKKEKEKINQFGIDTSYKSISLYNVSIYNICNELEIFKDELDFERHKSVIEKWYLKAISSINHIEKIFEKQNVKGALVFHGHLLLDACLLEVCKKNKIDFLTIELTANKSKIVWDDKTGYVVTYNRSKLFFKEYFNKISSKEVNNYVLSYIQNIGSYKRIEHLSNNYKVLKSNKPYILFLGQVYNDASQLFTIGEEFVNPSNVITEVYNIIKDKEIDLVIKLHPKEINGANPVTFKPYQSPTYNRLKNIVDKSVIVDYLNEYNTYDLIKNSQAVVTLNSQAGLESCLFDKPVFCFQKCFYSDLSFTNDYSNKSELKNKLEDFIQNDKFIKNSFYANAFFYIFFEKYCFNLTSNDLMLQIIKTFGLKTKKKGKLSIGFRLIKNRIYWYAFKGKKLLKRLVK